MKTKLEYVVRFFILLIVFFFQSSPIIQRFSVAGATPNIVFTILLVFSLYLKDKEVVTYALVIGSLTDIMFGRIYGVNTLLLIAFVCLYIFLNKYIYAESRLIVFVYCMLSTMLYESLLILINTALWGENVLFSSAFKLIIIKCVYNAVVILPVFYIARKVHRLKQEVHF